MSDSMVVRVHGLGARPEDKRMYFHPGPGRCGDEDTVALEISKLEGCWALPFSELERMYRAAVKVREENHA